MLPCLFLIFTASRVRVLCAYWLFLGGQDPSNFNLIYASNLVPDSMLHGMLMPQMYDHPRGTALLSIGIWVPSYFSQPLYAQLAQQKPSLRGRRRRLAHDCHRRRGRRTRAKVKDPSVSTLVVVWYQVCLLVTTSSIYLRLLGVLLRFRK